MLFYDSSSILALFNENDENHKKVKKYYQLFVKYG